MTVRRWIRDLHPGQLAIICLLAGSAVAGLLWIRRNAVGLESRREQNRRAFIGLKRETLFRVDDSLRLLSDTSDQRSGELLDYFRASESRRLGGLPPISLSDFQRMHRQQDSTLQASLQSRHNYVRASWDSIWAESQEDARRLSSRLLMIGIAIAAVSLGALTVLWTWFGRSA